jgi:hypothetical protein
MNDSDPSSGYGVPGFEPPANEQPLPTSGQPTPPQGPSGKRGFFFRTRNIVITAGIAVVAVGGITVGLVATSGSSGSTPTAASGSTIAAVSSGMKSTGPHRPFAGGSGGAGASARGGAGQGSNARAVNKPGGTAGTVSSVSSTGFTVTTTVGEKFTANESASTTYENATSGTSIATTVSAVTMGAVVVVLGTVNSSTIAATQVIVEPAGSGYTTSSADVTVLQRGQKNTSQSYGTIPAYTPGQGTIVGAVASDQAVTTALKEYPGGIVDRVVQLANGDYEVHDIGTDIHHIFENSSFQVIGAN